MNIRFAGLGLAVGILAAPQGTSLPLLSYLDVGRARIAFESDTAIERGKRVATIHSSFDDARRMLGEAARRERGDAGNVLRWMCYRLSGTPHMSLILEADEMSGERFGGFELVPSGTKPDLEGKCARSTHLPGDVQTNSGLRLGLTRPEVSQRLAVRGRDSADVVVYDRVLRKISHDPDGKDTPYDEASTLTVRFRNGRVVAFSGWRVDAR